MRDEGTNEWSYRRARGKSPDEVIAEWEISTLPVKSKS